MYEPAFISLSEMLRDQDRRYWGHISSGKTHESFWEDRRELHLFDLITNLTHSGVSQVMHTIQHPNQ